MTTFIEPGPQPDTKQPTGLLWGGIIAALLIPIIGFIFAIVLFAKNRPAHGAAVLLTCAIGFVLAVVLLAA